MNIETHWKVALLSVCLNISLPNIKVENKNIFLINRIMCSFHIFPLDNAWIEERQKNGEIFFFVKEWNYLAKFYPSHVLKMSLIFRKILPQCPYKLCPYSKKKCLRVCPSIGPSVGPSVLYRKSTNLANLTNLTKLQIWQNLTNLSAILS